MFLKSLLVIALFSSIFVLDLMYFFPVFAIILYILNSIEKDLKLKDRRNNVTI